MLSLKKGVKLRNLQPQMVLAAIIVDQAYAMAGKDATITSGFDGEHGANSLHRRDGLCRALDFRTRMLELEQIEPLVGIIKIALGEDFDVVYEGPVKPAALADNLFRLNSSPHLHVEYDPKG